MPYLARKSFPSAFGVAEEGKIFKPSVPIPKSVMENWIELGLMQFVERPKKKNEDELLSDEELEQQVSSSLRPPIENDVTLLSGGSSVSDEELERATRPKSK